MAAIENICVIGAGSWGTALAQILAIAGRKVTLYARDSGLAGAINARRENPVYLPGAKIDARVRATADPEEAAAKAHLALLATPAQHFRETLRKFLPHLPKGIPLVNAAKGMEMATGKRLSEAAAAEAPDHPYAVLSGPTFAVEAMRGLPAAATLATAAGEDAALAWAAALRGHSFRPYVSGDVAGVEIAGALKNVVAIACGIVEGKQLGQNAKAAVMTRGLAEIRRFGVARGAKPETFLGLAGVGDLSLTCSSMTSRNYSLGFGIGQGQKPEDILKGRRTVAEGVATAHAIAGENARQGLDMPICLGVHAILCEKTAVDDMVSGLLSRDLRCESE